MLVSLVFGEMIGPKLLLVAIFIGVDEGEGLVEGFTGGGCFFLEQLLVDHKHLQTLDGQLVLPVLLQDAVDVLES